MSLAGAEQVEGELARIVAGPQPARGTKVGNARLGGDAGAGQEDHRARAGKQLCQPWQVQPWRAPSGRAVICCSTRRGYNGLPALPQATGKRERRDAYPRVHVARGFR